MNVETKDLKIIHSALNEIVNGIKITDLCARLNSDENKVETLIKKLELVLEKKEPNTDIWECEELKLQRNALCEVFKELDSFEFGIRLGFQEDEVFAVLKRIRESIDSICYKNSTESQDV
jgi:hypothetical protein